MKRALVTTLASVCVLALLAEAARAETVFGIVVAGRAYAKGVTKPIPVTFIGDIIVLDDDDLIVENVAGRLVIGGVFVSGDVKGVGQVNPDGSLGGLLVEGLDSDGSRWSLLISFDTNTDDYTLAVTGHVEPFRAVGSNPVINIH